jgi:hypothetical protein
MYGVLNPQVPIADHVWDPAPVAGLAFAAGSGDPSGVPRLVEALASGDPVLRYWGLQGLLVLGGKAAAAADAVEGRLGDEHPVNRILAAEILCGLGRGEAGRRALAGELEKPLNEYSLQYLVNVLPRVGAEELVSDRWIEATLADPSSGEYLKRFARRQKQARR